MLKRLCNWIRLKQSPKASIQDLADGFELWVVGRHMSTKYIEATDQFLKEWIGQSWPQNTVYSRSPEQEFEGSIVVDKPLREALQKENGLSFLSLLAGNFTSICACIETCDGFGLKRIEITHEEESPAYRIHIPESIETGDAMRDQIRVALRNAGLRII